ncbi:OmpA family protein [Flavobacterium silvisoli]|uniref:OmpA family protein n=1 Tax=Flavobacterium silvisoli TaxID=2529433 RepID=A0A4Q9Z434_9FLAO|nr:OmpA family protein [Flavobacterium silvisoli]TBX71183.1 OmpA family protein [Flavobacterium silvisoli]
MKLLKYLPLLFFSLLHAQEEVVHSVYFDFDKFSLNDKQANDVVDFIKKTDSTRIESIQIFGYTDDIGKEAYNYKLSTKRATAIQNKFIQSGIKNKVIITIEGKGRILIDDDIVENLPEKRSKNRRVDVVLNLKPLPKIEIPGYYNTIQKRHIVGDHIYLDNVLFDRGSSKLTFKTKTELDKIAKLLQKYKNLQFEIQGHVCCTPPYQKEAIDMDTKKRQLSVNRAEAVYKYLILKKISKDRMTFKGYGNTVPLGKGAEYDRRVELVISKV